MGSKVFVAIAVSALAATQLAAFVPIRVNAGGPAFTDSSGSLWSADYGYAGGSIFTTTQAIGNTSKQPLYQSERNSSGTLQYQFTNIPSGTYTVNLRFVEIVYTAAGKRVFNVAINGQTLQSNYDIFSAAGVGFRATDLGFPVTVLGGQITIQFISVVQNAKIDAIEILQNSVIPLAVSLNPNGASLSSTQSRQFTATVTGNTNTAVTWSISPQVGTIVNGLYTAPAAIPSQQTVSVKAVSVVDGITAGTAFVTLLPPPLLVAVSPPAISLTPAKTQQFTATVTGNANTSVVWSMSPALGTLVNGLYTAPAAISTQQTVTVSATSLVDGMTVGTASVTLVPTTGPYVPIRVNAGGPAFADAGGNVWASDYGYNGGNVFSSPQTVNNTSKSTLYQSERNSTGTLQYQFNSIPAGTYTVNLRFAELLYATAGQRVFNIAINGLVVQANFDIVAAAGASFVAKDLSFSVTVNTGQITIQLISVLQSAKIDAIEILQTGVTPISVAVSPSAVTLLQNQSKQFSAIVGGTPNTAVNWSIAPPVGALAGGLYTSPIIIATGQTVLVKATSAADGTTSGSAAITLVPLQVAISPTTVALSASQSKQFAATVTRSTNTAVTWSLTPQTGKLLNGLYTAPALITTPQTVTVIATSAADGTTTAAATVNLSNLQVTVVPAALSMAQGQSTQFIAAVTGNANTAVTWSLSPAVGTLVNGLYSAPSVVSVQQMVTITATSTVDNSTFGTATVTLTAIGLPTVTRIPYLQTGTPTGVDIRWRTNVATDSRVRYGTVPSALAYFVDTSTAVKDHDVKLAGLLPNTRYYYSIGTTAQTLEGNDDSHYF